MKHIWTVPRTLVAATSLAVLGACASGPERPFQELARAEASIEQADQSGAREYGAAELDSAREKLSRAISAADDGDNVVAARYAREAAVDAELATAITRNRNAENAVEEINRSIDTLREEIARSQNQTRSGVSQ